MLGFLYDLPHLKNRLHDLDPCEFGVLGCGERLVV